MVSSLNMLMYRFLGGVCVEVGGQVDAGEVQGWPEIEI